MAAPARRPIFARLLAGLFTLLAVAAVLMFSVVALGVLLVGGAVFLGYFWWKTRVLRRALREQQAMAQQGGFSSRPAANDADPLVIEGELIREVPEHETESSRQPG